MQKKDVATEELLDRNATLDEDVKQLLQKQEAVKQLHQKQAADKSSVTQVSTGVHAQKASESLRIAAHDFAAFCLMHFLTFLQNVRHLIRIRHPGQDWLILQDRFYVQNMCNCPQHVMPYSPLLLLVASLLDLLSSQLHAGNSAAPADTHFAYNRLGRMLRLARMGKVVANTQLLTLLVKPSQPTTQLRSALQT